MLLQDTVNALLKSMHYNTPRDCPGHERRSRGENVLAQTQGSSSLPRADGPEGAYPGGMLAIFASPSATRSPCKW
jgi:hypothetical protein